MLISIPVVVDAPVRAVEFGEHEIDRLQRHILENRRLQDRSGFEKNSRGHQVRVRVDRPVRGGRIPVTPADLVEEIVVVVRVLGAAESALVGVPEVGADVVRRAAGHVEKPVTPHDLIGEGIVVKKAHVGFEELLRVRRTPIPRGTVAKEPAPHRIVEIAVGHRFESLVDNAKQLQVVCLVVLEDGKIDRLGMRKFLSLPSSSSRTVASIRSWIFSFRFRQASATFSRRVASWSAVK